MIYPINKIKGIYSSELSDLNSLLKISNKIIYFVNKEILNVDYLITKKLPNSFLKQLLVDKIEYLMNKKSKNFTKIYIQAEEKSIAIFRKYGNVLHV